MDKNKKERGGGRKEVNSGTPSRTSAQTHEADRRGDGQEKNSERRSAAGGLSTRSACRTGGDVNARRREKKRGQRVSGFVVDIRNVCERRTCDAPPSPTHTRTRGRNSEVNCADIKTRQYAEVSHQRLPLQSVYNVFKSLASCLAFLGT